MSHPWGSGRLEFLAFKTEIETRVRNGFSVKSVFKELCNEGKITMTYTTFYRHCRKSNFVVGSNIDPETLQRFRLTPEEEAKKRRKEELDEIIRQKTAEREARKQANERILRAARLRDERIAARKATENG